MTNVFECGTVRWFHPQKRFGFIRGRWGFDIFFHYNDGRFPTIKEGEVDYGSQKEGPISLPDPKPGDAVFFERTTGSKGRDKASPWCYEEALIDAERQYQRDQEDCPTCHHRMGDHAGGDLCMMSGCHCGDEAYEHEEGDHPFNTTPSWSTGLGGMEGYES